ncbi:MAG: M23 family metallopeptidase [Anaerolineales bacterium]
MTGFKPISINKKNRLPLILVGVAVIAIAAAGYFAYRYLVYPRSPRWNHFRSYQNNPPEYSEYILQPGQRCGDAPFAFPTTGVVFGMWDQSYRPGHRHSGLDIFSGTEPGVTPVYAAYDGYLTCQQDWVSTVIIRIPDDPLHPGEQIWTYYTHMASKEGESFVAAAFPPGTTEEFVRAGTLLGYQGNYSGDPVNPTGLHLHFSVVRDDGRGGFLNELEIKNTYDPSPYFNLPFNNNTNPDSFAVCDEQVTFEDWDLEQ